MSYPSSKHYPATIWQWFPLLASPLLFGAICKVFPIDYDTVLLVASVFFLWYFLVSSFMQAVNSLPPLIIGIGFIVYLCTTPFWAMNSEKQQSPKAATVINAPNNGASKKYTFSFNDAHADPAAFTKWWNFFVSEVVRTNKIIFELDKSCKPDAQGAYPYKPIPKAHAVFYQGNIIINNHGYRGDDFSIPKGNNYRILTIGDSVTFGQSLFPDSRSWPAVLQALIRTRLRCRQTIEIINGGVNGYHLKNSVDQIERDHNLVEPDLVLSYVGWNSMADLGVYPPAMTLPHMDWSEKDGVLPRVKWYAKKAFATIINEEMASLKHLYPFEKRENLKAQLIKTARKGLLFKHYKQLIEQSRRFNFKLILLSVNTAVTPESPEFAKKFYEGPWPGLRSIIKQVEIHNELIQEIAQEEKNVLYIDTSKGLKGNYDSNKFIDIVHFSTAGDQMLAENIFNKIRPLMLSNDKLQCSVVN